MIQPPARAEIEAKPLPWQGAALSFLESQAGTVGIIIEGKPWQPSERFRDKDIVSVPVNFAEKELRDRLKAVGGKWNPVEKVWHVLFGLIRGTELEGRILVEGCKRKQGQ